MLNISYISHLLDASLHSVPKYQNMFAYKSCSFWTPLGSATLLLDLSRKNHPRLPELPDYKTDQVEIT